MSPFDNPSADDEAWTARLRSLREPEPPEPRPFFYARLYARLHARLVAKQAPPAAWLGWLHRPAYTLSLAALVLAVNAGAALHYTQQQLPKPAPAGYAAFATEYQLDPFHLPHG